MSATTGMRVADLAAAARVSADTVRYYERVGLLPAAERTASGYRTFGPAAVDRLRFIQGAQRLGLRLRLLLTTAGPATPGRPWPGRR